MSSNYNSQNPGVTRFLGGLEKIGNLLRGVVNPKKVKEESSQSVFESLSKDYRYRFR